MYYSFSHVNVCGKYVCTFTVVNTKLLMEDIIKQSRYCEQKGMQGNSSEADLLLEETFYTCELLRIKFRINIL